MSKRLYSKSVANGNRVVWTNRELLSVPFTLDGLLYNEAEWGMFRVTGRDMYCAGFRVDFRVPSSTAHLRCRVGLYSANDVQVAGGVVVLDGITMGGEVELDHPLPAGSTWKFKLFIESDEPDQTYFPQGVTATYWLRFAHGTIGRRPQYQDWVPTGVGFDRIGGPLTVFNPVQPALVVAPSITGMAGGQENYGGNEPGWVPEAGVLGVAVDTSTQRLWLYYAGAWH